MGLFSSEPPSHFPAVEGRRLDGADVRFPRDLPADATLLIVLFQDELDPLSDQWARLGDRIAEGQDGRLAVLEVPVVTSKLKMLGDFATMGIRGQVDHDAERERTVPIFADVKAFRKVLQVKTGDVYPFLVARDGRIAWRGEGQIDMDEVDGLEAAVADVLGDPVPPYTDHPDVEPEDEAPDDDAVEDGPRADAEPDADSADADRQRPEPDAGPPVDADRQPDAENVPPPIAEGRTLRRDPPAVG